MRKTINILTVGIFSLATSTTILTSVNHFNSSKNDLQKANATTNQTSLFNNQYQYLNNSDWITNRSTTDHKFYSYDTSALKSYTFTNSRNVFLVDTTGNLVYNTKVTIPNKDKSDIENTKQEMITKKKVTLLKSNPNYSDAYNFSEYQQNYFVGDNNWTYLQFGGLEQNIDISNIAGASKIENNNNLSENLGLYYIADAAINNKISLAISYNISQQFINKSSLNKLISNQLTNNIINLIVENTNIFNFIKNSPLFLNIKDYSLNFIFDNDNNLVAIYYTKWNIQNINQNISYHYKEDFSNINKNDWAKNSDQQIILNWTKYAKNWEQFSQLYPKFNFNNSKLSINNMGTYKENNNLTGDTNNITTNKNIKYELQNPYNVVIISDLIIQLPIIDLYVYHDDNNIYYQWNARVTSSPNLIAGCSLAIDLDNISFQFKK
ncbi:hypothetical protein [Spiroplasma endosymbiont of Danaus chrysippus]|uniref:hypothetical protein n=1 Tax=Spiroplasma endosymbiont of Danaus chrysippus TaxID=2691041 RepID=UPI0013CB3D61|nr:hypothetical protein [Spiroplasma endosymbiont of Danaus chrysippus]CAB1054188.1 hypothetical protein [Spiroplasma endosymbiont of Danaus chrysippus]